MKGAVIDLGTNTFSILIFENNGLGIVELATDKEYVNLGEGGINDNYIVPSAQARGYITIERFVKKALEFDIQPQQIVAFATSAIRNASNRQDFIQKIVQNLKIRVELINGHKEAEIVYEAVKSIHRFHPNLSCIMDIGGGSTEFTITNQHSILKSESFEIGLSRLLQMKELSDPLSDEDISEIIQFLDGQLGNYFEYISIDDLVGVGGSYESYFQMIYKQLEVDFSKSHLLPMDALQETLDFLIHSSFQERVEHEYIVDFRKRLMNIAALKTQWALQKMNAKRCYFSPASLKEGIVLTQF